MLISDLKKLIKYEASPREPAEPVPVIVGPSSVNVRRLFEANTITSKSKQKDKLKDQQHQDQHIQPRPRARSATIYEVAETDELQTDKRQARVKSADAAQQVIRNSTKTDQAKIAANTKKKPQWNAGQSDKENNPATIAPPPPPQTVKSKMWIRPKTAGSQLNKKGLKKTDPVSLYQSYQKDWEKFKSNICESSHSDLRWSIREKMMGNR